MLTTCGEHEYTRYGFRKLLEGKCADVLQPDITWLGGMTEKQNVSVRWPQPMIYLWYLMDHLFILFIYNIQKLIHHLLNI